MGSSAILIENSEVLLQLQRLVGRMTCNPALRKDLMQEAMIHLWQVQEKFPGQTTGWYIQNCRFHLSHYLTMGRSIDSLKRGASQVRPCEEDEELDDPMDRFPGTETLLQQVIVRDLWSSLLCRLSAREAQILAWSAEGRGAREIARRLAISHPMVVKYRRKIAQWATSLLAERPAAVNSCPGNYGSA